MQRTGRRDTPAEIAIRTRLHALGYRYRVDHPILSDRRRKADIVFTRRKVAIFIDGCFWHGCPRHGTWPKSNAEFWREKIETNRLRDLDTNEKLREKGWLVLRIWEHEAPDLAVEHIVEALKARIA